MRGRPARWISCSPRGALTLGDLDGASPEVNRRTLQRDIKAMLDKGLLGRWAPAPTDPNRHYVLGEL